MDIHLRTCLLFVTFNMRFIFVVAGWTGSAHDTRILNHALANFSSFPVPPKGIHIWLIVVNISIIVCHCWFHFVGKYYLADSGYPNRIGYLAPYKGRIYNILEFRLRNRHAPQGKYEVLNFLHSSFRNAIEQSSKEKWHILKGIPSFSVRTQKHIIFACVAVHNFICDSYL
jgi:hypothetical protein